MALFFTVIAVVVVVLSLAFSGMYLLDRSINRRALAEADPVRDRNLPL